MDTGETGYLVGRLVFVTVNQIAWVDVGWLAILDRRRICRPRQSPQAKYVLDSAVVEIDVAIYGGTRQTVLAFAKANDVQAPQAAYTSIIIWHRYSNSAPRQSG